MSNIKNAAEMHAITLKAVDEKILKPYMDRIESCANNGSTSTIFEVINYSNMWFYQMAHWPQVHKALEKLGYTVTIFDKDEHHFMAKVSW